MSAVLSEEKFSDLFTERYLEGGLPRISGLFPGPLVAELDFVQGRPDFVCASYPTRKSSHNKAGRIGNAISSPSGANLLAHLKPHALRSTDYLRNQTGLTNGVFENAIENLKAQKLIKIERRESNVLVSAPNLPQAEVCVFELKIEKWRRAVFQALQYRVAANSVAIVMPSHFIHRIEPFGENLRKFGIGVISLDTNSGKFRIVIHPKKNRPLSMRHHYLALGAYLKAASTRT